MLVCPNWYYFPCSLLILRGIQNRSAAPALVTNSLTQTQRETAMREIYNVHREEARNHFDN